MSVSIYCQLVRVCGYRTHVERAPHFSFRDEIVRDNHVAASALSPQNVDLLLSCSAAQTFLRVHGKSLTLFKLFLSFSYMFEVHSESRWFEKKPFSVDWPKIKPRLLITTILGRTRYYSSLFRINQMYLYDIGMKDKSYASDMSKSLLFVTWSECLLLESNNTLKIYSPLD